MPKNLMAGCSNSLRNNSAITTFPTEQSAACGTHFKLCHQLNPAFHFLQLLQLCGRDAHLQGA